MAHSVVSGARTGGVPAACEPRDTLSRGHRISVASVVDRTRPRTAQKNPIRRLDARVLLAALLAGSPVPAAAQEQPVPIQREIIPGSELMTPRERERYRVRMRTAPNAQAQAQVREEHVKQMRERARLRGLALAEPGKQSAP